MKKDSQLISINKYVIMALIEKSWKTPDKYIHLQSWHQDISKTQPQIKTNR